MMSLLWRRLVLLLVLGFVASGSIPPDLVSTEKLTIAYIGDEIGRLEPCG